MLLHDVRYGIRGLRRSPGTTLAAVVSLTLGLATATTVFSLVNATILRPPPFRDADRLGLLNITWFTPAQGESRVRWSWSRFNLLDASVASFSAVATTSNNVVTVTGVDDPEPLPIEIVSSRYLTVLGVTPELGRDFAREEDAPATISPVVILGHDLWQSRLGGADDVVGRTMELNGVTLEIIGVAPQGFDGVSGLARAWIPAMLAPRVTYADYLTTNQNFITVVGRLRPGVSVEAARAEMALLGPRIQAAQPSDADTPEDRFSATVTTLNEARVDVVTRRALWLLAGATALLLLIACANVASLLLGRAADRAQEVSLRLALGASRAQLVRQLLGEGAVLAVLSGLAAMFVTSWALTVVRVPPTLARGRNFYGAVGEFATPEVDWRVVLFAMAVSLVTVLGFALAPALRATRTDLVADLKSRSRAASGGRWRFGPRDAVVAAQVTLSMVLLVGCGLLVTSYGRLRQAPLGFDPNNLLTFMIRPSEVKYGTLDAPDLLGRMLEEIERVDGVESATVDGCTPLSVQCASAALHVVGRPWPAATSAPGVLRHYVPPAHFQTLRVPILRGRALTAADRAGAPHVVVINQAAADRFWPDEDPIGQRIWFEGGSEFDTPSSAAEIVGVVGNTAYQPLDENPVQPDFFTSYAQFTYASRMVMVRSERDPLTLVRPIAQAVRRADPDLALFDVQTMTQRARLSWSKHTAQTTLFALIALMALCLAVTGVYAVAAHFVIGHMREIGVRIALGASTAHVLRVAIERTVVLGVGGCAAGFVVALALSRVLRATLYDTSPLDGAVYAAVAALLLLALCGASYLPARRALRIDPMRVLREE